MSGPLTEIKSSYEVIFLLQRTTTLQHYSSNTSVKDDQTIGRHLSERVVQLDQLEGGQQLPRTDLPHVHVEEPQMRLLIQLVHGFKLRLCKGPAEWLWAPLQTRRQVTSGPFQNWTLTCRFS